MFGSARLLVGRSLRSHAIISRRTKRFSTWRIRATSATSRYAALTTCGAIGAVVTAFYWRDSVKARIHATAIVSADETVNKDTAGRFSGKTVLITGAAGDLGSEAARAFAEQKARVVLCDLPAMQNKLEALASELLSLGSPGVIHVTMDVTEVDQVKQLVQRCTDTFGGINILFNNAGIAGHHPSTLQFTEESMFKRVQEVNVYGVFLMMKYVSNHMIQSGKGGAIVNVSSTSGLRGSVVSIPYCASKFAVSGMTRAAAKDLAHHGIRVCAVAPYYLEGNMADIAIRDIVKINSGGAADAEECEKFKAAFLQRNPMGRMGKMSEVVQLVMFLSSEEASYINGVVIPVDGGYLA